MADIGYATLQVIPSMKGLQRNLSKQVAGPARVAGVRGGRSMGAGLAAGIVKQKAVGNAAAKVGRSAGRRMGVQIAFGITREKAIIAAAAAVMAGAGASAGLVMAAALASVPLAFAAIGIAAASTSKKVKNAFSDLGQEVKKGLISAAKPLVPVLVEVADRFSEAFQKMLPSIRQIFKAIGPMIRVAADSLADFAERIMPTLARTTKAAIPIVQSLFQGFESLAPSINKFFNILIKAAPAANQAMQGFFRFMQQAIPAVANALVWLNTTFRKVAAALNQNNLIIRIANQLWGVLKATWVTLQPVIRFLANLITGTVIPALRSIWQTVSTQVIPALKRFVVAIRPLVRWLVEKLGPVVKETFRAAAQIIRGVMQQIAGWINLFTAIIKGDWRAAWNAVKQILSGAWQTIKGIVRGATAAVRNIFWNAMKALGKAALKGVRQVVDYLRELKWKAIRAFAGWASNMWDVGVDAIKGLIGGIKSMAARVASAAKDVVKGAILGAKRALRIGSPSKVFREIGAWTSEGMALGIGDNAGMVTKAVNAISSPRELGVNSSTASGSTSGGGNEIRVFIGDRELTNIVRTEVHEVNRATKRRVLAGGF